MAQAFLTSPKLVGRDADADALRKRLLRALRGRGGAAALVAPAGLGRSRMLASFVLEAKLLGAVVIARRRERGRLGCASAWPLRSPSACSRRCR